MLGFFVGDDNGSYKRNHLPRQTMRRVDDDHSLKRMQFEAAYYGLDRDHKYNMRQKMYDWWGWNKYFSWRDLPIDCTPLMSLYVAEINRIANQLTGQPSRCVSILIRADQEDIVPVRVEQAGAMLAIMNTWPRDKYATYRETMNHYLLTRPDFFMAGSAFNLTEVGAANFAMKMVSAGMIPGFTGFFNVLEGRKDAARPKVRPELERNLLEGLTFESA